ncbi:MAG: hypothetical protein ACXVXY_03650 [Mycobacteriaceae bacterium]
MSEPIAAFSYEMQHASQKGQLSSLFDPQSWSKAYQLAQSNNAGQALTYGLLAGNGQSADPFKYNDPYGREAAQHGVAAPALSWGMNIAGSWYLDPAVLAGKSLSALRASRQFYKLSAGDKAGIYNAITQDSRTGRLQRNMYSRTDKYLDWINGKNSMGRPLEGPEILFGTPELSKYGTQPQVVAGLLADATKLGGVDARNAQRRILAVAAGDPTQIDRLRAEIKGSGAIADALSNMLKDSTVDLKLLADNEKLQYAPEFMAHLEGQLHNLNSQGEIDQFMEHWNARQSLLLDAHDSLTHLPGFHSQGARAVNRLNDTGLLRAPKNLHEKMDEWAARQWSEAKGASTLYQKGLKTVPLLAIKPFGLAISPYTKGLTSATDALRQVNFTGVAHLHDWAGSTTQLDSMMRLAKVSPGERMKALSEAYLATSEMDKMRAIEKIEGISMRSMADEFSAKYGREIDRNYIEALVSKHAEKRGLTLASLRGRAYAATEAPPMVADKMAARMNSLQNAADQSRMGEALAAKGASAPKTPWRVDQVLDDQGIPVSLPLFESQLANAVPLLDMSVARKLLERDNTYLSRLSKAWRADSAELGRLSQAQAAGATGLENAIAAKNASVDWLVHAGEKAMRVWKFSVLFRLGYPMRVLMDDHWRIWTQMRAGAMYGDNGKEFLANLWHNAPVVGSRNFVARKALYDLKVERQLLHDELEGDRMVTHPERQRALKKAQKELDGHNKTIRELQAELKDAETRASLGTANDLKGVKQRLADAQLAAEDRQATVTYLLEQLGDHGPDQLKARIAEIEDILKGGMKGLRADKLGIGSSDFVLDPETGAKIEGAFGGQAGTALRGIVSSKGTFDAQMSGVEDRMYQGGTQGSHRTIPALTDEGKAAPGHLDAWADVINHQFRYSPVAMHFINGGDLEGFVKWVKQPEQAQLRQRLSHFAHDPEDWGGRVRAMVHDYIPSEELRAAVAKGRVSPHLLSRLFQDPTHRPSVHGRVVADNLGISERTLGVGKTMHHIMRFLGEMPTDRLSRHPYFNSLYKQYAQEIYDTRKIAYADAGKQFGEQDFLDITQAARKRALSDVKRTLFDLTAHSHAAHVMRFISPFFAAHQESLSRWWRIVGDDPSVVRRFAQAFDVPRHLHLEVDQNGNIVPPGAPISKNHYLLLQMPQAFGGPDPTKHQTPWRISENSFNIVLQSGLGNPGVGPIVSLPIEYLARKYADEPEIARIARVFNPYPPQSPMESVLPATLKRMAAYTYGETGVDPTFGLGVGQREYNDAYSQHVQDLMVDFHLQHGREPNYTESKQLMLRAGREATTQMFHRVLWNALSPAPANPTSKYALVQHGWYQISQQARDEGRDFNWAYAQFKNKFGDAYMPLVYSASQNPGHLDPTTGTVSALKKYRSVLNAVDPALSRAVIGGYADELAQRDPVTGAFSTEAQAYLRSEQMNPGSPDKYYSYDDPGKALEDQMARRGWTKYSELTGALTAQAQQMGLNSYNDSPALVAIKRAGLAKLEQENWAFAKDYASFDPTEFDRYILDLKTVANTPSLKNDPERTDIQTLGAYLKLRDLFVSILAKRDQAGLGGPDAKANLDVRTAYTALVGKLVESNTYFESNMYNGLLERDPLLVGD